MGGRVQGQQVVDPFPHFLHPGADLWAFLVNLSALLTMLRVDLQSIFLKLGGCLRAAIGGLGKVVFSSGF